MNTDAVGLWVWSSVFDLGVLLSLANKDSRQVGGVRLGASIGCFGFAFLGLFAAKSSFRLFNVLLEPLAGHGFKRRSEVAHGVGHARVPGSGAGHFGRVVGDYYAVEFVAVKDV